MMVSMASCWVVADAAASPTWARRALTSAIAAGTWFCCASASARMRLASMLLARRIGLDRLVYFVVIHRRIVALNAPRPASTTGTRGSFMVRYAGATV